MRLAPSITDAAPRRRVLFAADEVTLAHVVRPLVLAQALRAEGHDVTIATGSHYAGLAAAEGMTVELIESISPAEFQRILWTNATIYPVDRLRRFVQHDLR